MKYQILNLMISYIYIIGKKLVSKIDDLSDIMYQKLSNLSTLLMEEHTIK